MSSRRGGALRQLGALLATFGVGLLLVVVLAVVAPDVLRIGARGADGVSAAALTHASQELAEAAVRELPTDAAADGERSADDDADAADDGADPGTDDADGERSADDADDGAEAADDGADPGTDDADDADDADDGADAADDGADPGTDDADDGAEAADAADDGAEPDADDADDGAEAADAADAAPSERVLELVNAERAAAGCPALRAEPALDDLAAAHASDMAARGYLDHTTPEGLSPWDRAEAAGVEGVGAENIARGQPDAAAVVAAWMDSPGHRANILSCDLTRHGLGVAQASGGPWWTQVFGR
ncbi:CAP domain-containing protein [Isoptericola halotolerans]|uniref:CAP domain-containing protein n=1 Tax=Isoptericola halotolerans TaxID=300560 RepID=UPI00388D3D6A